MDDPLYYMTIIVDGVMIPLLAAFGIVGNMVSIAMLRSPKLDMKVSFRYSIYSAYCTSVQ